MISSYSNTPPLVPDAQYSSYYPQYHQPLQILLGKPLYLEVRLLNAPDPSLVLLVHFCVAYPRSGKSVWVLLYNGYVETTSVWSEHQEEKQKQKTELSRGGRYCGWNRSEDLLYTNITFLVFGFFFKLKVEQGMWREVYFIVCCPLIWLAY